MKSRRFRPSGRLRRISSTAPAAPLAGLCWVWLCASVVGQPAGAADFQDREQIRRTAEEILSSSEFRHLDRLREKRPDSQWTRGYGSESGAGGADDAPSGTLQEDGEESQSDRGAGLPMNLIRGGAETLGQIVGAVFHTVAWIFLAVVCAVIVYLIVRTFREFEGSDGPSRFAGEQEQPGEPEPQQAPGELAADVYVQQARELAALGRYRDAVAHLLLGAMSHLERAGLIQFRPGLTYRDYLRAARSDGSLYSAFRVLVRVYEPLGFGRREATAGHFERSLSGYEAGFRGSQQAVDR